MVPLQKILKPRAHFVRITLVKIQLSHQRTYIQNVLSGAAYYIQKLEVPKLSINRRMEYAGNGMLYCEDEGTPVTMHHAGTAHVMLNKRIQPWLVFLSGLSI